VADMTTINKKKFSTALKNYRKNNDLTLQEMAEKIPTTLNTIYRWESGKTMPTNQITKNRLKEIGII